MEIIRKLLTAIALSFALAFLIFACTKKDQETTTSEPVGTSTETPKSHDQNISDSLDKMGFKTKEEMLALSKNFESAEKDVEKFKACLPISSALANYKMRESLKKDIPNFTKEQYQTLNEATEFCQWAGKVLNEFEESLTKEELQEISQGVDNSIVPYTQKVFSTDRRCSAEEYTKLLNENDDLYTNPRVLSAILILVSIQRDGNAPTYIPRYKKIVERKDHKHKDLIFYFIDQVEKSNATKGSVKLKKASIAKATKAFSEFGIKNVETFMANSLQKAPNCLSSIGSGVIDISKNVATQKNMIVLHKRIVEEVKKNKKLPTKAAKNAAYQELTPSFLKTLEEENLAYKDSWFRPLLIKGESKNFILISRGKDRNPNTKDDLQYPKPE